MNGYEFLETISKGAHSTIIHSQQPSTNTIAVTKCIELSKLGKKCLENLDKLKESNKNVCKLITKFSDAKIQYLVYEYCNGDTLATHVANMGGYLEIDDVRYVGIEVVKGLNYIHSLGFTHGDLKLSNVLIHNKGLKPDIKLSDFGGYPMYDNLPKAEISELQKKPIDVDKIDVWLLGKLLLAMVSGKCEKLGSDGFIIQSKVKLPLELLDFLNKSLRSRYEQRMDWNEVMNHPFISAFDLEKLNYEKFKAEYSDGLFKYKLPNRESTNFAFNKQNPPSDLSIVLLNKVNELEVKLEEKKSDLENVNKLTKEEYGERMRAQKQTYANLRSWIIKGGGEVGKVDLENITDGIRKVIARKNIKSGNTILFVPDNLFITIAGIEKNCEMVKKILGVKLLQPNNSKFSIWCLEERKKPETSYKYFFKTFLENIKNYPLFYTKKEMDLLIGSPMIGRNFI